MIRKIVLVFILLGLNSIYLEAAEKGIYQEGCEDIISGKWTTSNALAVTAYIAGTKDMKMDRLNKMNFDAVVGIDVDDLKPICRQALKLHSLSEFNKLDTRWSLHFATRGYIINKNGYTWDEVQKVCKEAKKKMGLIRNKKY